MYERPSDLPAANWYPDPERPERYLRYWDGEQWTVRQLRPRDLPKATGREPFPVAVAAAGPHGPRRPFGRGTIMLGTVARVGIIASMVVAGFQVLLYAWGLDALETALYEGDYETVDTFDDIDMVLAVLFMACFLGSAVSWMVWQWRLARAAPTGSLRRAPGWHAWGWVVPIVSFWFPYQNVSDLWRAQDSERSRTILGWWWGAYLAVLVLDRGSRTGRDDIDSFDEFRAYLIIDLVGCVLSVAAAALAIRVLSTLNAHARRSLLTPEATPAA